MQKKCHTISIRMTDAECANLTNAWKKTDGIVNRAQFIRAAINAYAGEQIFD